MCLCSFVRCLLKHRCRFFAAPVISMPPQDAQNYTGNDVIFGCEVSAYPMPQLEWKKKGNKMFLPGDDTHVSVQVKLIYHCMGFGKRSRCLIWAAARKEKMEESLYVGLILKILSWKKEHSGKDGCLQHFYYSWCRKPNSDRYLKFPFARCCSWRPAIWVLSPRHSPGKQRILLISWKPWCFNLRGKSRMALVGASSKSRNRLKVWAEIK